MIPDVIRTVNLTGWLQTCQAFHSEMTVKLSGYSLKAKQETESGSILKCPLDGATVAVSTLLQRYYFYSFFFRDLFWCFPCVDDKRQTAIEVTVWALGGNCPSEKTSCKTGQVVGFQTW